MKPKHKINGQLGMKIFNTPLMVQPEKADIILAAIGGRFGVSEGADLSPAIAAAMSAEYRTDGGPFKVEGVLVVPVLGTLVHRYGWMDAMSGLQSYQELGDLLISAAEDNSVKGIVLDICSGGGEVSGVFDLVETIAAINDVKPVWAVANEYAFSAAYALASACDKIFIPQTGGVGSVGVIAEHADFSRANEMAGITVTQIAAGDHKLDTSMSKPLSDAGRARLQDMVNMTYDIFVESVAAGRGMKVEAVRATQAQVYFGQQAVDVGFADGVDTLDNVVNNMIQTVNPGFGQPIGFQAKGSKMRMFGKKDKTSVTAETDAPAPTDAPATDPATVPEDDAPATDPAAPADEPQPEPAAEPATVDQTERAAMIADFCAQNNMGSRAAEYIRSGMTMAEIEEKVGTANEIRAICKRVGKPELADSYIGQGLPVNKVSEALLNLLAAEDESRKVTQVQAPGAITSATEKQPNVLAKAVEEKAKALNARK